MARFAKFLRVLTIPPLLILLLFVALRFSTPSLFPNPLHFWMPLFFLGILPTLAYPLQMVIPSLRRTGRAGQRKLAFLCSLIGYIGAVCYVFLSDTLPAIRAICVGYLLSLAFLIILNKCFSFRASGHGCGVTGPLLYLCTFLGWVWILPCIGTLCATVWSSLRMKRHTITELACGAFCALLGFSVSFWILQALWL